MSKIHPLTALKVDRALYEPDVEMLDRYQGFSKEVIRLSGLALASLGFLLSQLTQKEGAIKLSLVQFKGGGPFLGAAVALLISSIGCAMVHLYLSSDGFGSHISMIRKRQTGDKDSALEEKELSIQLYKRSYGWLIGAWFSLIFALVAVSSGAAAILF